jgi:hypothetical protein
VLSGLGCARTDANSYSVAVVFFVFASVEIVVLSFGLYLLFCASRATLHALTGFDVDAREEEWET